MFFFMSGAILGNYDSTFSFVFKSMQLPTSLNIFLK